MRVSQWIWSTICLMSSKMSNNCSEWKTRGGSWLKSGSVESGGGAKTRPPLLSEEMRWKSMDGHNTDALFLSGHTQDRNLGRPSSWRSKSTGRSMSPGKSLRTWWKCGKTGHYKKDFKSKKVEKPKGSDSISSTKAKTSTEEGGDVYLESTGKHEDLDVWLIYSGVSYHTTPHRE